MLNLTGVSDIPTPPLLPSAWHFVRTPSAGGAHHMAFDLAMMSAARVHQAGVWRTYGWDHPTVSFGRNERLHGAYDAQSVASAGLAAVRRPTGGRALLHGGDITYSVAFPVSARLPWGEAYAAVNAVLLAALHALGVPAQLASAPVSSPVGGLRPDGAPCFAEPSAGEIMVNHAKLVGSAIWREEDVFLQHGSILLHDHQYRLEEALAATASSPLMPPLPAATLAACLPLVPSFDHVAEALEAAVAARVNVPDPRFTRLGTELVDGAEVRVREHHFRDSDWLWRR